MKSRRALILTLLLMAASTALLVWKRVSLSLEPSYHGKPLSFYVSNLYLPKMWDGATFKETTDAFLHFGMDGAPHLAQALGKQDFKLYRNFLAQLPQGLARHLPEPLYPWMVGGRAGSLLVKLGPTARSAVPNLIPLLQSNDPEVSAPAAEILGRIGSEAKAAVPALIGLLKTGKGGVKNAALAALCSIGFSTRDAVEALPLLIDQVKTSTDARMRVEAIKCLGMIGADG